MIITLRRDGKCADCGRELAAGTQAKWYKNGAVYCLDGHNGNGKAAGESKPQTDWLAILKEANDAAAKANADFAAEYYKEPAFAVVEHENQLDDSSPIVKAYPMNDVCGFVWLELRNKDKDYNGKAILNKRFIADFKRFGKETEPHRWAWGSFRLAYYKDCGVWSYPWILHAPAVGYGNGSMSAMESAGHAFTGVMLEHGVDVFTRSRID